KWPSPHDAGALHSPSAARSAAASAYACRGRGGGGFGGGDRSRQSVARSVRAEFSPRDGQRTASQGLYQNEVDAISALVFTGGVLHDRVARGRRRIDRRRRAARARAAPPASGEECA